MCMECVKTEKDIVDILYSIFMYMQHMVVLQYSLSVLKKTLLMLFPTLIAVNRSRGCRVHKHVCTDTH